MRYYCGIDIGSQSAKCIIIDKKKNLISKSIALTGVNAAKIGDSVFQDALNQAGLKEEDIVQIVSTGYGRNRVERAGSKYTEIMCHARGMEHLIPGTRTLIDIGGQDSKVLRVQGGKVENFMMNDKCAAGTGRFLEVMSNVLDCELSEMGLKALQAEEHFSISNICTIFAESEVISLVGQGKNGNDILWAIVESVAVRTAGLARRLGVIPPVAMSGGVSENQGVVEALKQNLCVNIQVSPLSRWAGALGAALLAIEEDVIHTTE